MHLLSDGHRGIFPPICALGTDIHCLLNTIAYSYDCIKLSLECRETEYHFFSLVFAYIIPSPWRFWQRTATSEAVGLPDVVDIFLRLERASESAATQQHTQSASTPSPRAPTDPVLSGSVHESQLAFYERFMQSELNALSPSANSSDSPQECPTSSQHGVFDLPHNAAQSPAQPAGDGAPSTDQQIARDAAIALSLEESSQRLSSPQRRLKPCEAPSPPVYNRVAEYEKAATPTVRKRDGPVFEVISRQRSPGDKSSPVQALPNGRLSLQYLKAALTC